jgi:hypothetical protein
MALQAPERHSGHSHELESAAAVTGLWLTRVGLLALEGPGTASVTGARALTDGDLQPVA